MTNPQRHRIRGGVLAGSIVLAISLAGGASAAWATPCVVGPGVTQTETTVVGGGGNDTIDCGGVTPAKTITGNGGNDTITGTDLADTITGGVGNDSRTLRLVIGVGDRAALPGTGLDQHFVAVLGEFADPRGGNRDPVLVGLDLGGYSDLHATSSLARRASQNSMRSWARERSRPVSSSTLRIR